MSKKWINISFYYGLKEKNKLGWREFKCKTPLLILWKVICDA